TVSYLSCFFDLFSAYLSDNQMDMKDKTSSIFSYFSEMPDFLINRRKQHLLTDIITITIAGVICGMESYDDIEDFAVFRQDWFKTFLELPGGIPSHDTINRVFSNMDPARFEACF